MISKPKVKQNTKNEKKQVKSKKNKKQKKIDIKYQRLRPNAAQSIAKSERSWVKIIMKTFEKTKQAIKKKKKKKTKIKKTLGSLRQLW